MTCDKNLFALLAEGFKLFPCRAADEVLANGKMKGAKSPLTERGHLDATNDMAVVEAWADRYPGCAWGTPTSDERGVVDINPRHGGDAAWAKLVAEHGPPPGTWTARTGGGGWHIWLRFPEGTGCSAGRVGPGIDVKATGGYVIVPPSRIAIPEHAGRSYAWTAAPWKGVIGDAPGWLVRLLAGRERAVPAGGPAPCVAHYNSRSPVADPWTVQPAADLRTHPGCGAGARRKTLCEMLAWHTANGAGTADDLYQWAGEWAGRCDPPFGEWEKHVAGYLRREHDNPLRLPPPVPPDGGVPTPVNELTNSPVGGGDGELVHSFNAPADGCIGIPMAPDTTPVLGIPRTADADPVMGNPITAEPVLRIGRTEPGPCEIAGTPEPVPGIPVTEPGPGEGESGEGCHAQPHPFCLHPDAFHGPIGRLVQAVGPHTEADDPAVLVCLLAAFGSAVGWNPMFDHGKPHGGNLFVGLVGATASRKGTATGIAKSIILDADPTMQDRIQHEGFGSGEGLIWGVRDASGDDLGVTDKRLLVIEEEWAKTFTLSASDKSILTPTIRGCFDRIPIGKRNRGENAYGCKQPHVGIIANVTPDDLRMSLTGRNAGAVANGYLNRFLLVAARRRKHLPRGGRWREHAGPFVGPLRAALEAATGRGVLALDADAGAEWDRLYPVLEGRPPGVAGDATARASDMVMKLALVYALADGDEDIRLCHLRAGVAVWRYCEATAVSLFGGPGVASPAAPDPTPDPLWLRLLMAIEATPGILRGELLRAVQRHGDAAAVGRALDALKAKGAAHPVTVRPDGGGRPGEAWFPGPGDGDGGGHDNPLSPAPDPEQGKGVSTADTLPGDATITNAESGTAHPPLNELTNSPSPAAPELERFRS